MQRGGETIRMSHRPVLFCALGWLTTITGTAAAKECGMPLSTFRYRAEIYEKAKLL